MAKDSDSSAEQTRVGVGDGPLAGANLLYLASQPYERIEVEVQCVGGCGVTDRDLDVLATFLRHYTDKPVDLSVQQYARPTRPLTQQALALELMRGQRQPGSAYLFVLLYDGSLTPAAPGRARRDRRPYTSPVCPHVIMVDVTVFRFWLPKASCLPQVLHGEAGHVLGLCANRAHGDGNHCGDRHCLMRHRLRFFGIGRRKLCPRCQQDLADARQATAPRGLCFRGPFLIRQKDGYLVAAAPGYLVLKFCPLEAFDPDDEMRAARKAVANATPGRLVATASHDISDRAGYLRHKEALKAAAADPYVAVAAVGRALQQELGGKFEQ